MDGDILRIWSVEEFDEMLRDESTWLRNALFPGVTWEVSLDVNYSLSDSEQDTSSRILSEDEVRIFDAFFDEHDFPEEQILHIKQLIGFWSNNEAYVFGTWIKLSLRLENWSMKMGDFRDADKSSIPNADEIQWIIDELSTIWLDDYSITEVFAGLLNFEIWKYYVSDSLEWDDDEITLFEVTGDKALLTVEDITDWEEDRSYGMRRRFIPEA